MSVYETEKRRSVIVTSKKSKVDKIKLDVITQATDLNFIL